MLHNCGINDVNIQLQASIMKRCYLRSSDRVPKEKWTNRRTEHQSKSGVLLQLLSRDAESFFFMHGLYTYYNTHTATNTTYKTTTYSYIMYNDSMFDMNY